MLLSLLLLLLSLLLLTVGAELLVRGSSTLALRAGISPFVVGMTIVGFGTSAPELAASVMAALREVPEIAVGNVVGSNIANVLLVLGVIALVKPIPVEGRSVLRDILLLVGVSLLPYAALATGGVLGRTMGVLFFAGLLLFLYRSWRSGRQSPEEPPPASSDWRSAWWFNALLAAAGIAVLVSSSALLVDSAVSLATSMGVSELVIGLTIVAVGTSMPELVTSLVAALRGRSDLGLGNIVGSGIFNILGILGLTAAVHPIEIAPQVFRFDMPLMILAAVLLLPFAATGRRISRVEGGILAAMFAAYLLALATGVPGSLVG
jgi:cation:H+ antiporter